MPYDADLSFNYFAPTKVIFGKGSTDELPMEVSAFGKRAFLVTDEGLVETGLVDQIKDKLGNLLAGVYADVPQDSGMDVADQGAESALSAGADVVVSLGGGSVIDTAKGMCIVMTEGGSLKDFQGMQLLTRPQTPHVVIPTTAGTGSEVTSGAVVLDRDQGQKIIIFEYFNTPRVAILDSRMTEKLPADLTASTGMDAMTHAVESYVAQARNPISDSAALHAIKLIVRYLPTAVENGADLVARGQMQVAALLAGWAFSNAMVGLVHAMAHSLGAVCRIPHGLANGMLLSHVMRFNANEIPELTADIAEAMGVAIGEMDASAAANAAADKMETFARSVGLNQRLRDLGVTEEQLKACADLSMSDGSIIYNPRMVEDAAQVLEVYLKAY
ncbi:MAG: iron-containing alcohol dehydrogenase [Deltaproteobacteria bacterium]|jgi:alcohol dehydrogenase class IV|nr:iron-containing alcohol dehydrogenase [Deltaproteobacteria bacterium]